MLLWQLAVLDTWRKTVFEVVTADTMKTGKAIAIVIRRAIVATDIHTADEEVC